MRYTRLLPLLAALMPMPALAQSAADHDFIKVRFESVRAPMFASGRTVTGVTATYTIRSSGCETRVEVSLPSHVVGTNSFPARADSYALPWRTVSSVEISGDYVHVYAPGLPNGGRKFYTAGGSGAMKAAMDRLRTACGAPGTVVTPPAPAPVTTAAVSAGGVGARERLADVRGTPQCRFRNVPELTLSDNLGRVVKRATYRVPAREGGKDARFSIGAQAAKPCPDCATVSNWRGILANPSFSLEGEGYTGRQAVAASLNVDGAPVVMSFYIQHAKSYLDPSKYSTRVTLTPAVPDEPKLLEAMARGNLAVLRVYGAGNTLLGTGTFGISSLRQMPRELEAARWTCG